MRAIIIDDEQLMVDLLERKLNDLSEIEVIGKFTNPHRGLVEVTKERPDVVFLDISMPEISGMEIAKQIQAVFPKIKIVFITAYQEYAVHAFEMQVEDYILKPLNNNRLLKTIHKLQSNVVQTQEGEAQAMVCCFNKLAFQYYQRNREGGYLKVTWRTTKARELFSYLIHYRNQYVPKDNLAEYFWPELATKEAYSQLYSTIYQIRKSLEKINFPINIISKGNNYKLKLNDVFVDVDVWEEGIERLPFVNKETIIKHRELLSWYQGNYFAEEKFTWAENERDRLCIKWVHQLKRVADYYLLAEDYSEAILLYLKYQKVLPHSEESYFMLMKLYAKITDYYAVHEQYHLVVEMTKTRHFREPNIEITKWYRQWSKNYLKEI